MTRYSRSVIPGRSNGEGSNPADLDRMVFGQKGRGASADNDDDDVDDDDDEDEAPARAHVNREGDRRKEPRRKGPRRMAEFAPLPGEGKRYKAPEDNKRGAVLLMGAAAVVGVFGLVVWNAYREGVRPQDANTAPLLETSGSFKSKPEESAETKSAAEQASVFEQVEAPRPNIEPTPEVRPEAPPVETAAAPPPKPVETKPAEVKPAVAKTTPAATPPKAAEAKPADVKPAETKPVQAAVAPAPKAEAPISLTPKAEPAAFKPAFATDGKFAVQIAAAGSEAAAIGEWNKHVKFSPELFSAAERFVVQAEVNGKTVYRLRAGSFASSADADAFCGAFKAKGGACFRVAK
ncbi:MAG TPA: SPOR domain-containing protein [Hyphomonadaceae bacterium]